MLSEPGWLLLALPFFLAWWYWPQSSRWSQALRATTLVLLLLALAGLAIPRQSQEGVLIVVADRSASMPPESDARHKEVVDLLHRSRRGQERLGVVAFGKQAVVELSPTEAPFPGFVHEVDADGSALAAALDKALELIPQDRPGRILVLSDGRWTGVDPETLVSRLVARKVAVDYRLHARGSAGDLAIAAVEAPSRVLPNSGFLVSAWLDVPAPQTVRAELLLGDTVLASLDKDFPAGRHRVAFHARGLQPGTLEYRLRVTGEASDPVPENNSARILVQVTGGKPILHVSPTPGGGLGRLLQQGGFQVVSREPKDCRWNLETLSNFSAVLLENVAADSIGVTGLNVLSHWIRDAGGGLMMTGGRNSYAMGGYYGSPLEEVLPLSLEMREEHRKFSVAIVVVLDRSGSMAVPVAGGKVKMDLANLGTAQVLDLLHPHDEIGVIAVDSAPHIITPLVHPTKKAELRNRILGIQSMGGGIFVYTGLLEAARMIQHAKAATRHIILFADAADAEEPGEYVKLLAALRSAGVTVSVIGLGTPHDVDAEFLRDVARRGGGNIYFTDKAEQLPILFAQETFKIARSTFIEEVTPVAAEPGLLMVTPRTFNLTEPVGGYNLCYLKPDAVRAAVTQDEFRAPLVAVWHRGLGRVVCYTAEVDGKYTGPIARWAEYGDFLISLARWAAGADKTLPHDMAVTQDLVRGGARIRLHLDVEQAQPPFTQPPSVLVLRQRPDGRIEREQHKLVWVQADLLELQLPLSSTDTVLATLDLPGHGPVPLPPVCLPYSPEHEPSDPQSGASALARLALATGGVERADVTTVWQDLPSIRSYRPLCPWLVALAWVTLLLEVLERRTGWLTALTARIRLEGVKEVVTHMTKSLAQALRNLPSAFRSAPRPIEQETRPVESSPARDSQTAPRTSEPSSASGQAKAAAPATSPSPSESVADAPLLAALRQARRRSQRQLPPTPRDT
ncbi:MAG: VWA domain-containing protein [Gemmatales bacterium]|nr:VWA domain-containing protein [Gemmatales bacterium]MDW8174970.1 VWA domain-containing protein [Gemmatales bacterium]